MSTLGPVTEPLLSIRGLSKTFTGQRALRDVDFDVDAGEVRALVGQNGSGKSTLVKILAGYHKPDSGATATFSGESFELGDPAAAFAAGLRFVHQDLGLVPSLSAIENLALGRGFMRNRLGTIAWRREYATGNKLLEELGYKFDFRLPVSHLSASEKTGIAVARALEGWEGAAKLLVLDEPTASLPAAEVTRLFEVVRAVRSRGVAIIYVSHHFNEVFEISDRVTVLRDGRHIDTRKTSDLDESGLIALTIGRSLEQFEPARSDAGRVAGQAPVLSIEQLSGSIVDSFDLDVHAGEIVGIAGVTGSGREELAGAIFGALPREGRVLVDGEAVPPDRPDRSMARGMVFVPPDRATNAALGELTLRENITISRLGPLYGALGLKPSRERSEVGDWLTKLDVVPNDPEAVFNNLSGGNQQKIVLARALRLAPRVLVLDEPTQGVDIGAKAAIHHTIRLAAESGAAVVVASTESEELVGLCDRVIILNEGHATTTLSCVGLDPDEVTDHTLRGLSASA